MRKQFTYITIIIFINSLNPILAQTRPSERGICYAKCLLKDYYETWEETYPVYMGEKADSNSYVESIDIALENEEPLYIQIVTDTILNKDYIMETFLFEKLIEGEYTKWREIVCAEDVSNELLYKIADKLISLEYLDNRRIILNKGIKEALVEFQKDNNLPVGLFDLETLKQLEITKW